MITRTGPALRFFLLLGALAGLAPATAAPQEQDEPSLGAADSTASAARNTGAGEISSEYMAESADRLADAKALANIDAEMAVLEERLLDLIEERKGWRDRRGRLIEALEGVKRDIDDTNEELDRIEEAIIASMAVSAGIPNPELVSIRETLRARKRRLREQRADLRSHRAQAEERISEIDGSMAEAEAQLAAKRAEKQRLEAEIRRLAIVAPPQGARLLVDSDERLLIHSDRPPRQLHVEVQQRTTVGGPGTAPRKEWTTVYARTLDWDTLERAGPGSASLAFKTGTKPQQRSMPIIGLEAFWLGIGDYRARVKRVGDPATPPPARGGMHAGDTSDDMSNAMKGGDGTPGGRTADAGRGVGGEPMSAPSGWRGFTVVGRVDSSVIKGEASSPGEESRIKYGTPKIKPGTALRPVPAEDPEAAEEDD